MGGWPAIGEPELLARLAMSDEEFIALAMGWAQAVGPREFSDQIYERALGYPWARPAKSFLLTGEQVQPLDEVPTEVREEVLSGLAGGNVERYPLLAFGSNGAPETLMLKFGHLAEEDRRVLVTSGNLYDFDVGAAAMPTVYGAVPATIFPSPGTAVRASVLWATTTQLVALTWSEISYRLGRLEPVRFDPDNDESPAVERVFAFASRWGAHCVDGEAVAMQAIPAVGRVAPALTQERLLDQIARSVFGDTASARDLVTRVMEDFSTAATTIGPVLRETARPFRSDRWTPFPASPVHRRRRRRGVA
jgi:hypothetical protein